MGGGGGEWVQIIPDFQRSDLQFFFFFLLQCIAMGGEGEHFFLLSGVSG